MTVSALFILEVINIGIAVVFLFLFLFRLKHLSHFAQTDKYLSTQLVSYNFRLLPQNQNPLRSPIRHPLHGTPQLQHCQQNVRPTRLSLPLRRGRRRVHQLVSTATTTLCAETGVEEGTSVHAQPYGVLFLFSGHFVSEVRLDCGCSQ